MLHVTPVGLQHDFFRLGGHSLRATRVTSRLFELFNTRVPLQTVFDATRLGDFVALFSEHLGGSESGQRTLALLARLADENLPVTGGSGGSRQRAAGSRSHVATAPGRRDCRSARNGCGSSTGSSPTARRSTTSSPAPCVFAGPLGVDALRAALGRSLK